MKKVIVVGGSSGIGAELVNLLVERGDRVASVSRRDNEKATLSFKHDVRNTDEVPAIFQEVCRELGGLDMVIYAAGVMPEVHADEFNFEKDAEMIAVNLTGAVAWLDQAAVRFQNTNSGTIVGIGSVAGERGRQAQPVYNTTKAALHTYLEALRNRLSRHGVTVVTVKPGPTATPMTAQLDQAKMMTARQAAEIILRKSTKNGEHFLKPTHAIAFTIIRNIPSFIFRKLKI